MLTVRVRLTLLYTGLFAVCGAIVVAVSYALVSRVQSPSLTTAPANVQKVCEAAKARGSVALGHKCNAALQRLGAQQQHDVTLHHLLEYSLITLGVVIALSAILGWIVAGRALRPLELSLESQRRFIANASHELRTPLAVMRTTADVVLDDPDSTPADYRAMATDIRTAVDDAEHLIGALFILARNEHGLATREEVDLATVVEDVLDTADAGDRQVHAMLEPAPMSGDPVLAEHLVANLVDNAIRYNGAGGEIWVTTRTVDGGAELRIANTGPVVTPADAERLFQPFQRLNGRTSHDGFGLGLAIVASIASVHGGTATADPRDEGGLTVTVTVPTA